MQQKNSARTDQKKIVLTTSWKSSSLTPLGGVSVGDIIQRTRQLGHVDIRKGGRGRESITEVEIVEIVVVIAARFRRGRFVDRIRRLVGDDAGRFTQNFQLPNDKLERL